MLLYVTREQFLLVCAAFSLDRVYKTVPDSDEKRLFENGISDMHIYPGKSWVMCLGVIVPDILKYQNTVLIVNYTYKRLGRRKEYSEDTSIDFKQYSKCMVYISEIDELRKLIRNGFRYKGYEGNVSRN